MLASATEALDTLAKATGLGKLSFGTNRICRLDVGDTVELEIEDRAADGILRLNAAVRVVGDADFSVLRALLAANFNGEGTGKAALAINTASGEIALTQPVELLRHDAASFCAEVETFIRYVLFWQSHAGVMRPEPVASTLPQEAEGMVNLRL